MPELRAAPRPDVAPVTDIYLWKTSAMSDCPDSQGYLAGLLAVAFLQATERCFIAADAGEDDEAVKALVGFTGVQVRVASAFLYWMVPDHFQLIDRRATGALNLDFADEADMRRKMRVESGRVMTQDFVPGVRSR